jgi:predicted secreted hydrolase
MGDIELPKDQYGHAGAPTEWWWHIGTVYCEGRPFGFEINATGRADGGGGGGMPYGFMQIMVTDAAGGVHYQTTCGTVPLPDDWAETDPTQPWSVALTANAGGDGTVSMKGAPGNCQDMSVEAQFTDTATGKRVALAMRFVQTDAPLLVWGTGCKLVNPDGRTPLERNNYYYSFTKLSATGTITIGDDAYRVQGLTWMDHQYGFFGGKGGVNWVLQNMQLDNGYSVSSFTLSEVPQRDKPYTSGATILAPDGTSTYVTNCTTTPRGEPYPSKGDPGIDFFLQMDVEIPEYGAQLTVASLFADQEFPIPNQAIYEGAGTVTGTFLGETVSGTAWLEEKIAPPSLTSIETGAGPVA